MSQFLPETRPPALKPGVDFAPTASDASGDVALMQRIFSAAVQNPSLIPPDFMAYVVDFIQTQRLTTPLGQVIGYTKATNSIVSTAVTQALADMFVYHVANFETEEPVTSTTYTPWTSAPSLSGLDDGHWFVLWGCSAKGDDAAAGAAVQVAARPNGSGNTNFAESQEQSSYTSIARGDTVVLAAGAGANTLQLVALTTIAGHTSKVRYSWIAALKFSN